MSDRKWTKQQDRAINSLDGSLIVTAAAGSGKTAVLIERIITRICNNENPCPVDKLLVVTFTRAAANEMRERLSSAIDSKISLDPDNNFLKRQKMMLPTAEICTMDQFLNNLVKDNFHQLGIMPDYRIADKSEIDILSAEVIEEILDDLYEENSEDFNNLINILGCEKSDDNFIASVKQLDRYSSAYEDSEKWLNSILDCYSDKFKPQDTYFGKIILEKILSYCNYAIELNDTAMNLVKEIPELDKINLLLLSDRASIDYLKSLACDKNWNLLKESINSFKWDKFPIIKNDYKDSYEKVYAKLLRDEEKDIINSLNGIIPANEDEYVGDIKFLSPIVKKLIDATLLYRQKLSDAKQKNNIMEFNDILHLALKLLIDANGNPTDVAKELKEKYTEILIDEYQDTNEAQDAIFCTLSNNKNNMFLVGDVKQSIYRFRLAMPHVFLNRIKEWKNSENEYPMVVNLDKNFRSRQGVLENINYLFSKIMSERIGDMVYDEGESLKYGANYSETDSPEMEVCILDSEQLSTQYDYSEEQYIADKINLLVNKGVKIKDKNGADRPIEFKDICVLYRKKKAARLLCTYLNSVDIPAYFEDDQGFFGNTEVSVIMSLLSIIDNPLQDIPLLTVLMSPIFGFTPDDMARIRLKCKNKNLYYALKLSDEKKCVEFLKHYNEYRRLSTVLSISELIRLIYENTGYLSIVTAMPSGNNKKLNLLLFLEYAMNYEKIGNTGLSGFIRFIENVRDNGSDLKPASSVSEYADVVRIMTIHKSKGLEFPVVIMADCANARNRSDTNNLIIHEKTGVGVKVYDKKNYKKYTTVQYEASKCLSAMSDKSEELRVLYVAMTRAKEKLIVIGSVSKPQKFLQSVSLKAFSPKVNSVAVETTGSLLELLLIGYMRHPDAAVLRQCAGYQGEYDIKCKGTAEFVIVEEPLTDATCETDRLFEQIHSNKELVNEIYERTHFQYPYMQLSYCATKKAASSFNRINTNDDFFACDKPRFTDEHGLTPANKGTAMHRFMETADLINAKKDLSKEKEKLLNENKMSKEQIAVLDDNAVAGFLNSQLYDRMSKAEKVMKEQKFTVFVPVTVSETNIDERFSSEKILVQGVIDCAFIEDGGVVVVDYKTDKVNNTKELADMYKNQLQIYKLAAQEVFCLPVKQMLIYSFNLSQTIEI